MRSYLVLLALAFQLKLEDGFVEGIEQARGLEIVDAGKIAPRTQTEMGQELVRRRVEQGPSGTLTPAGGARYSSVPLPLVISA